MYIQSPPSSFKHTYLVVTPYILKGKDKDALDLNLQKQLVALQLGRTLLQARYDTAAHAYVGPAEGPLHDATLVGHPKRCMAFRVYRSITTTTPDRNVC